MFIWILCGLIIFASTLNILQKNLGANIPLSFELVLSMVTFAVLGPISIIPGSIILNDFRN